MNLFDRYLRSNTLKRDSERVMTVTVYFITTLLVLIAVKNNTDYSNSNNKVDIEFVHEPLIDSDWIPSLTMEARIIRYTRERLFALRRSYRKSRGNNFALLSAIAGHGLLRYRGTRSGCRKARSIAQRITTPPTKLYCPDTSKTRPRTLHTVITGGIPPNVQTSTQPWGRDSPINR